MKSLWSAYDSSYPSEGLVSPQLLSSMTGQRLIVRKINLKIITNYFISIPMKRIKTPCNSTHIKIFVLPISPDEHAYEMQINVRRPVSSEKKFRIAHPWIFFFSNHCVTILSRIKGSVFRSAKTKNRISHTGRTTTTTIIIGAVIGIFVFV